MKIDQGKHTITFTNGVLYVDGISMEGEVHIEFNAAEEPKDPNVLGINVSETIKAKAVGPGGV